MDKKEKLLGTLVATTDDDLVRIVTKLGKSRMVTIKDLITDKLTDIEANFLAVDGSNNMVVGYMPDEDQDVVTVFYLNQVVSNITEAFELRLEHVEDRFTDEEVVELLDLIYDSHSFVFTLTPMLFERDILTAITSLYTVDPNDADITGLVIDGVTMDMSTIDGSQHSFPVGNALTSKTVSAVLHYNKSGVAQPPHVITRTTMGVYLTYFGITEYNNITDADVLAAHKVLTVTNSRVAHKFDITGAIKYGWFAVEKNQTGTDYVNWKSDASSSDTGLIGGFIIKQPAPVMVDGLEYEIYIFDQPKNYANTITLTK